MESTVKKNFQIPRIVCQLSIPTKTPEEGKYIYEQLKKIILSYDRRSTMNGQLIEMLEPCCEEKKQ